MHKGLKPRSMSETSHLPTDVESSGQDPSLHYILSTRPSPPPPLRAPPSPSAPIEAPIEEQRGPLSESRNAILRTCPHHDHLRISPRIYRPPCLCPSTSSGEGNKDPAVAPFVAPCVDNGDSGARVIEGLDISTSHSIAAVGLVPNFVEIIFRTCFLSIIS